MKKRVQILRRSSFLGTATLHPAPTRTHTYRPSRSYSLPFSNTVTLSSALTFASLINTITIRTRPISLAPPFCFRIFFFLLPLGLVNEVWPSTYCVGSNVLLPWFVYHL